MDVELGLNLKEKTAQSYVIYGHLTRYGMILLAQIVSIKIAPMSMEHLMLMINGL